MINIVIALILFTASVYIYNNIINPASVFLGIWIVVLAVYEISLSQYSPITERTSFVIGMGLVFFFVGAIFFTFVSSQHLNGELYVNNSSKNKTKRNTYVGTIKYNLVFLLCILSIILLLPDAWNSFRLLLSGNSFQRLRTFYSAGETIISNRFLLAIFNYIINPFCVVLIPLCAVDMFVGQKKKWLLVFTFLITFLITLNSAGRIQIAYIFLHFFTVFLIIKQSVRLPRKVKIFIFLIFIFVIVIINYITKSRGSSWTNTTVGLYISGGIPLLDNYINNKNIGFTYGAVSLSGFLKSFFSIIKNFGFKYPLFLDEIQPILDVEKLVDVGKLQMNAFVTLFYYFFIDGGYIGVLIGSVTYGFISSQIYRNSKRKSYKWLVGYCLIVQGLVFSMVRLQFVSIPYCLSFIVLPFLFKSNSLSIKESLRDKSYENFSNFTIK